MKKGNYLTVAFVLFLLGCLAFFYCMDDELLPEGKKSSICNEKNSETVTVNSVVIEERPRICDIITEDDYAFALCEDGSVWEREYTRNSNEHINLFKKMEGLNGIVKIINSGSVKYALSSEGYVYAWGVNQFGLLEPDEEWDKKIKQPIVIDGIDNVIDMDAQNGSAFAIDKEGNFYAWGLPLYREEKDDTIPGFPEEGKTAVKNVKKIFAGAGEHHYFMREDGSIFSILSPLDLTSVDGFIYPDFTVAEEESEILLEYYRPESSVQIDEGSKYGHTILYEMGSENGINQIDADGYTMFVAKTDGTLWYWNSDRIEYHDCRWAMADINSKINYGGRFIEVDYKELLDSGKNDVKSLAIVDLCSGKENVLFLTNSEQVFISKYITTEIKDAEYYNRETTNPYRTIYTSIWHNLQLKSLSFQKLDYENIVRINTNGEYHFSLIDTEGNYFDLDMS